MFVTENRFGGLAVTTWTVALLGSIFVDREPGRVDSEFDELPDTDLFLETDMRNLKLLAILSVHFDAVD